MSKVLLISPPYVDLYGKLSKAAGRYFPLGIGYIASYLRYYGKHTVKMYEMDAQRLSYSDMAKIIKDFEPDFIGLTCSTPSFFRAIEVARIGRKCSKAKIILGGVHASALPEFILNEYPDCIDCVAKGEGEHTMLEVINAYLNGSNARNIKGTVYRQTDKVIFNDDRPFIENLDSLPFPARDLIPSEVFMPNLHNSRHKKCFSIITSRGCPFNCSFCASRIVSGKVYRMHSAEYVLDEMTMLKKQFNARQLLITDDTFTVNRRRLEKICNGMIQRRLNLEWFCFSQISTVNKEILKLMKKAGCYNIGFGIESADEETLRRMGKPINPAKALEAVRTANSLGLKTQAFYIFGANESKSQIEKTINFAKQVASTLSFFNMLVPYPGTREFQNYFSGIETAKIDWANFVAVGENCVLKSSKVSSREIEKLMAKAYYEYYINPSRMLSLMSHIKTFYELCNYIRGGLSLLKQTIRWSNKKAKVQERSSYV